MFSTCIFCNNRFGQNESIEAFPVGERLAFDPARGRLWVVCRTCERWNLTPLEERWEAIEQAERLYTDTRRRVSTDNIGLARLADGTTLVRIGEPQRPEFAAWRYGDQFGRRRKRALLVAGGGVAAVTGLFVGGAVAGVGIGGFGYIFVQLGRRVIMGSPEAVVAKVRVPQHGVVQVRRRHLAESGISTADDGSLALSLRFKNGSTHLTGTEAERVASIVLPKVNRFGGKKSDVDDAVRHIEMAGHSENFLRRLAAASPMWQKSMTQGVSERRAKARQQEFNKYGLFSLPSTQRLALEMALHEEAERRALEGELQALEQAWKDAEEIAGIADNLFLPSTVGLQLDALKGDK